MVELGIVGANKQHGWRRLGEGRKSRCILEGGRAAPLAQIAPRGRGKSAALYAGGGDVLCLQLHAALPRTCSEAPVQAGLGGWESMAKRRCRRW